jgi:hypothetical protein
MVIAQSIQEGQGLAQFLGAAGPTGVILLLLIAVFLLGTRRVVTKRNYDEMVEDRDFWRDAYMGLKSTTEQVVDLAAQGRSPRSRM